MTPLERVSREKILLLRRARESRLDIGLHVTASGASFEIADPSTGRVLLRSKPAATRSTAEFQRALDQALIAAII
jgi:hypothetical protein